MLSCNLCMFFTGLVSITSSIALYFLGHPIMDFVVCSLLVLTPNSKLYYFWRDIPIPTSIHMHIFNWTNPGDISNKSIKPKFDTVGPYRFWEKRKKINITWNSNNTVTFGQLRYYHYDEEHKNGNLSDVITTLDSVNAYVAHLAQDWGFLMNQAITSVFDLLAKDVHITTTIDALICSGIDDPLNEVSSIASFVTGMKEIPFDKMGLLYIRNGSTSFDGVFNMATEKSGNLGELLNWNYDAQTEAYPEKCSQIYGSAGEIYPGPIKRDFITFFFAEICRPVRLEYEKDVIVNGITGYKYVVGDSLLDNGTIIPGNECYCNGECLPSGMLNLSACRYGLPMFFSLPHFFKSDPVYLEAVEGLQPEKEKHELYVVIEPTLGIPLDVKGRVQLNYLLHPVPHMRMYEDVPRIFFPIAWVELSATLPEDWAWYIRTVLNIPFMAVITASVLGVLGVVLIICARLREVQRRQIQEYVDHPYWEHQPLKPKEQLQCIMINRSINSLEKQLT